MRPGKVLYERQWMFFFFFRKRKRTKSVSWRTRPCLFYEPGTAKAGVVVPKSQCRNTEAVTEGLSGQWFNVYWSFFSFPDSRPLPGEIRQHLPALRAGKGVHFVAEAVGYAGANSRARKCLPVGAAWCAGQRPSAAKRSVAAVLIFWLLLDQAKSNSPCGDWAVRRAISSIIKN